MTPRNALKLTHAATEPQVFMCRQCMAVRVEGKDGLCPPCVRLIAARERINDDFDKLTDIVIGLGLTVVLIAFFYIFIVLWTN